MAEKKIPKLGIVDPSSYSNPEKMKVIDMELFLDINFERKILSGKVHLKCEKQENINTNHLILDTRDLNIFKVTNLLNKKKLEYDVGEKFETFGSSLCITLPPKQGDGNLFHVCIEYETSPEASALQWLTPEQTLGREEPFMFSQCQAIHCRSIIPCQDTPAVKSPYKAEITAPKELMVLMSAVPTEDPIPISETKLLWKFSQEIPIPPYLIAIVAGRLKGKVLGGKSKVYSEPEIVKACAFEFSETDKMLNTAIKICGPYVWGRYDLLVLPPSFPFGGMENPCLTFITPTLLAGDKSLANVIAHEIAHSWTGNLVTNVNFEHFWLNEGFTTYVERKIIGLLYGEPRRHFQAILGLDSLRDTVIKTLGETNPLTCLVPRLKNIDPDDAFSCVPYEKGHTFLFYLETLLNEDDEILSPCQSLGQFNKFLQSYLNKFKFKTVKTDDFKDHLYEFFQNQKKTLDTVDWNTWFYCPGMPPVIPEYDNSLVEDVEKLMERWYAWVPTDDCLFGTSEFNKSDIGELISDQICLFLAKLLESEPLSLHKIKLMSKVYHFNETQNAEIKFRWLRVCIKERWKDIIPVVFKFVNEQGRMKFVRPLYRDLYQWEEVRQSTISNFLGNRRYMMFVLSNQLEKDLHLNEPEETEEGFESNEMTE